MRSACGAERLTGLVPTMAYRKTGPVAIVVTGAIVLLLVGASAMVSATSTSGRGATSPKTESAERLASAPPAGEGSDSSDSSMPETSFAFAPDDRSVSIAEAKQLVSFRLMVPNTENASLENLEQVLVSTDAHQVALRFTTGLEILQYPSPAPGDFQTIMSGQIERHGFPGRFFATRSTEAVVVDPKNGNLPALVFEEQGVQVAIYGKPRHSVASLMQVAESLS